MLLDYLKPTSFYIKYFSNQLIMSQNSLFNIQQISSRIFNQEHSMIDTSLQHFGRETNVPTIMSKSTKKSVHPTYQQVIKVLQQQIERYKNALAASINYNQQIERRKLPNNSYDVQIKQLMSMIKERDDEIENLKENYDNAIMGLKQTVQKNGLLYKEVERYKKKVQELELSYSRDQNVFTKSQNLISNLSITKSNYEIDLVNMKDSLIVLEKQNKKIVETNEQYEEKLALLSQQIQRLRGVGQFLKKDNEKSKIATKQLQQLMQRVQTQNQQSKRAIERLRLENRDLVNSNSNVTRRLNDYHQKIVYKETIINDLQDRQARIAQTLRLNDSQAEQLNRKVQWYSKQLEKHQLQSNSKLNEYAQEIGKLRMVLNEKFSSQKKIEIEKQQILREYNQLILRFESLKRQHQSINTQKHSITKELQELNHQKIKLIKQIQLRFKQRQQLTKENQNLKQALATSQDSFRLSSDEKVKQYQVTIRSLKENESKLIKQFQAKLENVNRQKNQQVSSKVNQINKLLSDITSKDNYIDQFRSEIINKTAEIAQLKQSNMSQSTIIDTTKRDFDEKIRQTTQMLNLLKAKLQNYQKLIQQNRRERDLIFQEKNALQLQLQKGQQYSQIKNNEIQSYRERVQSLSLQLEQLKRQYKNSMSDVDKYKRTLTIIEKSQKQHKTKAQQSQASIQALNSQLQRIAFLLRDKQTLILQLNSHILKINQICQDKNRQVLSLRQLNQKLADNLNRSDQSKGNFQAFMKQIQRLNQVIRMKQSEIKSQRLQMAKIMQKIDLLYQQHLKLLKIIESTSADDLKKNGELNMQLGQLEALIVNLNYNTTGTLRGISKQSGTILDLIHQNDLQANKLNSRLNDQPSKVQSILSRKDQQILVLKCLMEELLMKLRLKDQQHHNQEQMFSKIRYLAQQNAAIKQQLENAKGQLEDGKGQLEDIKGQHQLQLSIKDQSILQLQSKAGHFEKRNKKQIQQIKAFINQNQLAYNQNLQSIQMQNQGPLSRLAQSQKPILPKQKQSQIFRSKDKNKVGLSNSYLVLEKEVQKLRQIIDLKNNQLSNNQESFFQLKEKLNETQKLYLEQENMVKQLRITVQSLKNQMKELQRQKKSSQKEFQGLSQLKLKNKYLQQQFKNLQEKLAQSENGLQQANNQINSLKIQLNKMLQMNTKSINAISLFQSNQSEKRNLIEIIQSLQDQLQDSKGRMREIQIEYNYVKSNQQQTKIHLHAYQYKTAQLEKEYLKLRQILVNFNNQNSRISTKNYFFQIQLKKAQLLHQKIQVLNAEINRLSSQNIDLNEQVISFKLAFSGECSLEKKSQEQLLLIFLLFTEIQSMRNRLKQNEQQLSQSHNQQLYGSWR